MVEQLTTPGPRDLIASLRTLQRAVGVLGWKPQEEHLRYELMGFPAGSTLDYRVVQCQFRLVATTIAGSIFGLGDSRLAPTFGTHNLLRPLSEVLGRTSSGYGWTDTGETQELWLAKSPEPHVFRRQFMVPDQAIRDAVSNIEQYYADWAIRAERYLRFGDLAHDIFRDYQSGVESALTVLGVDESLRAVENALRDATNPESTKMAVLGARNVLLALSEKLWQVPNLKTHPTLKNHAGKPLQLDAHQTKARLRAFLHERGVALTDASGKRPALIATQIDYVTDVLDRLYDDSSEQGKNAVSIQDARAIVLQLYLALGEIVRVAGVEPVTEIHSGN